MTRWTLVGAGVLALVACEAPQRTGDATASVDRYELKFDLHTGVTRTSLAVTAVGDGDASCFALPSNRRLGDVRASGVEGLAASAELDGVVVCGPLEGTQRVSVDSTFTMPFADSAIGPIRRVDSTGRPFTYLLNWIERCPELGPCDPAPSALSEFTFSVTHAEDDVVLCPGVREAGSRSTRCELLETKAPAYSALSIVSNPGWVRTPLLTAGGVEVSIFEVPEGTLRTELDASAVAQFLEWMTSSFGPFPYGPELRIATGPTQWLGMEHPANIVLTERYASLPPTYSDVPTHAVLHEIAHQWAGNRTTLASARDFVWKEATAEYLAYVFEETYSAGQAAQTRRVWHREARFAPTFPVPTEDPLPPLEVVSAGAYGTGPMLLFLQLEPLIGRPAILEGLRLFLADSGARSVLQLRAALEASSGVSLERYFSAWVFGAGEPLWPSFFVATERVGELLQIRVTQQGSAPCVVELEVHGATSSARTSVTFPLDGTSPVAIAELPFGEEVTSVVVDPDDRVVDLPPLPLRGDSAPPVRLRWHP